MKAHRHKRTDRTQSPKRGASQTPPSPPAEPKKVSWRSKHKNEIIINVVGGLATAVLIGVLFGFPRFVIENWGFVKGHAVFLTTEPIEVSLVRSLVNHQFILSKNPDGTVADFKITGRATTFQARISVTNNYDEPVLLSSLSIYGAKPSTKITSLRPEVTLAPSETRLFKLPEIPLLGIKDSLVIPALLSGRLVLKLGTGFGTKSFNLDCVCFSGTIQPHNDHLYWAGSDSSCLKFELEDPEGVSKQTLGFTKF